MHILKFLWNTIQPGAPIHALWALQQSSRKMVWLMTQESTVEKKSALSLQEASLFPVGTPLPHSGSLWAREQRGMTGRAEHHGNSYSANSARLPPPPAREVTPGPPSEAQLWPPDRLLQRLSLWLPAARLCPAWGVGSTHEKDKNIKHKMSNRKWK
jgi:hypothetical protein